MLNRISEGGPQIVKSWTVVFRTETLGLLWLGAWQIRLGRQGAGMDLGTTASWELCLLTERSFSAKEKL